MDTRLDQLERKLDQLLQAHAALRAQNATLSSELQASQQRCAALEHDRQTLQAELELTRVTARQDLARQQQDAQAELQMAQANAQAHIQSLQQVHAAALQALRTAHAARLADTADRVETLLSQLPEV